MRTWVHRWAAWLSEAVMGFLALAALALAMIPVLFAVSPGVDRALDVCEWAIVMVFALEYGVHLALGERRRAFVLEPWRLLDLVIILGPLISLLPQVSDSLRSTPVLRLLRLARAVAFGARAGGAVLREGVRQQAAIESGPLRVSVLNDGQESRPQPGAWKEFLRWVADPTRAWYHVSSLRPEQFAEVAAAAGLAPSFLEAGLSEASFPHIEPCGRFSCLFMWWPSARPGSRVAVERVGALLLSTDRAVISLSRHPVNLQAIIAEALPALNLPALPFPARMIYTLLHLMVRRHEEVAGHLERDLRTLEDLPVRDSSPSFFERTFRLKRELSAAKADLWRLKGVLTSLTEGRVEMQGIGPEHRAVFRTLADEADYLHATVDGIREGVLSLIELHLNIVSFDMNKFMRLLAVVSVLGLIPAVVGGLFGMNLADNPWPLTLPQVTFGVSMGMLLCLYIFFVKGWLR